MSQVASKLQMVLRDPWKLSRKTGYDDEEQATMHLKLGEMVLDDNHQDDHCDEAE